jgi:citrate lyase beta subunit
MSKSLPFVDTRFFSPWCLGSPLYMPAHRRDLMEIANGEKLPGLRTVIFCTEDAVSHADVDSSLRHLGLCLQGFRPTVERYRFVRARNPEVLARLLDLPHIEKIDGFVLPKFNADVFHAYFDQLHGTAFKIMPTLETKDVFDTDALCALRQALTQPEIMARILMLRIGGNDIMNLLGIRRMRGLTLYDTPMGHTISNLVTQFKPYGFALSAPVFEYLDDGLTLQKELRLDLAHGLTGKTAIHPEQVPVIEAAYRVEPEEVEMALKLLDETAPAVFKMHNAMCEVATHQKWGNEIVHRQLCYGMNQAIELTDCTELFV